jgi:hypothetical protein
MDLSALEKAWQNQVVKGGIESASVVAARLKTEVAIAQRRIRGGIVLATSVLFLGWAVGLTCHVLGIKILTPIELSAQGVHFLLFVAFLFRAVRSARVVRSEREAMSGTLRESLTGTLRTTELQIENARIAAWAIPTVVAINGWVALAKYFAGEFPGLGVIVGIAFMTLLGAAIGGAIWHRHRTHLIPLRRELAKRLRGLESEPGS